ncbi:MAG: hypothetical protein ACYTDY_08815 [Planctomycetota bacterium]
MSKRTLSSFLVLAALVAAYPLARAVSASTEDECDLKTVERAFYCKADGLVLGKKELVSRKAYYVCATCKETSKKSGKCEFCGKKREKKVSEKDVCPSCYAKPLDVEVCVKPGYACPKCRETGTKPVKCGDCRVKYKKTDIRALIEYRCPDCRKAEYAPGKCGNAECERHGQDLARTCTRSGKPPHVKNLPDAKKKGKEKKKKKP